MLSPPGALTPIEGCKIPPPGGRVTWPELKYISIHRTRNVDIGRVNMHTYNFFVSVLKFTFFCVQRRMNCP